MLNLVIFGPPGSGKGTQGVKIAEKYSLEHVSTGDLLRNAIHNNTAEGMIAKSFIDKGELVPDDVIIDIMDVFMEKLPIDKGILFDGFPRTVAQAEALNGLLIDHGRSLSALLNLEVENEELIERLVLRGQTSGRSDDNEETIKKRLEVYEAQTLPVLDYYKKKGVYKSVKGVGDIEEIFTNICQVLDKVVEAEV
ncbi:adenylate kinase [Carboxylicivirga caseinilyticus]|uniref:adenylate kinase n=1 Tax=Carboxylicivirga caseinilyticus TaxID=3417572 RepID=UPI003D342E38|nr:adenylate kinase [Marinilabiliaceae bacterium A049]